MPGLWTRLWGPTPLTREQLLNTEEQALNVSDLAARLAREQGTHFNPTEPVSACDDLMKVLGSEAKLRRQTVGGGVGTSLPIGGGSPGVVAIAGRKFESYDKDTNQVVRAYFACQLGLFKHPAQASQYVTSEEAGQIHKALWEQAAIDSGLELRHEKMKNRDFF